MVSVVERPADSTGTSAGLGLALKPVRNGFGIETMSFGPGRHVIGSSSQCSHVLLATGVQARHCEIRVDAGHATLVALDFRTWLNNGPVQKAELSEGDRLTIGPLEFRIAYQPLPPSTSESIQSPSSSTDRIAIPQDRTLTHSPVAPTAIANEAVLAAERQAERRNAEREARLDRLEAALNNRSNDLETRLRTMEAAEGENKLKTSQICAQESALAERTARADAQDAALRRLQNELGLDRRQLDEQRERMTRAVAVERKSSSSVIDQAVIERECLVEQRESALEKREAAVAGQDAALRERESAVEQRESDLSRQSAEIGARSLALNERENDLVRRETSLEGLDSAAEQRKAGLDQRESTVLRSERAVKSRELTVQQRESSLEQAQAALLRRETAAEAREFAVKQKETAAEQRDSSLTQRSAGIDARETAAAESQANLNQREAEFSKRTVEFDRRVAELEQCHECLGEGQLQIQQRDRELQERELALRSAEQDLAQRDSQLADRIQRQATRERALLEREKAIALREQSQTDLLRDSSTREETLRVRSTALDARETALDGREQSLDERDGSISSRQQSLAEQEHQYREREQKLSARANQLEVQQRDVAEQSNRLAEQQKSATARAVEIDARHAAVADDAASSSNELQSLQRQIDSLRTQLESERNERNRDRQRYDAQKQTLTEAAQEARREIASLEEKNRDGDLQIESIRRESDALKHELEELKSQPVAAAPVKQVKALQTRPLPATRPASTASAPATRTEPRTAPTPARNPATPEPTHAPLDDASNPDSVNAYMEQLLARTRRGKSDEDIQRTPSPMAIERKLPERPTQTPIPDPEPVDQSQDFVDAMPEAVQSTPNIPVIPEPSHRQDRAAVRADLDSLRHIANSAARSAIVRHVTNTSRARMLVPCVLLVVSAVLGFLLLLSPMWGFQGYAKFGWLAIVSSIVLGIDLLRGWWALHRRRTHVRSPFHRKVAPAVSNDSAEQAADTDDSPGR